MIVRARRSDVKDISRCIVKACLKLKTIALLENSTLEAINENFEKGDIFLFTENNKIKGVVCLEHNQISGLYVDPAYSGKNIGKKLLHFAENYIKNKGSKESYLYSTIEAQNFFIKNKYKPMEISISYELKKPFQFIKMKKKL